MTYTNDFSVGGFLILNKSPKRRLPLVRAATEMTRRDYSLLSHLLHNALPIPHPQLRVSPLTPVGPVPTHTHPVLCSCSSHLPLLTDFAFTLSSTHPLVNYHYTTHNYNIILLIVTLTIALTPNDSAQLVHLHGLAFPWHVAPFRAPELITLSAETKGRGKRKD